jgi:dTDP-4-dehydrorhamnose reductase
MLRLANQRPELGVVCDQTGCPTSARNLARVSLQVLRCVVGPEDWDKHTGTYHYCDATVTTWYDFARMIFRQAAELGVLQSEPLLEAIKSSQFPQLAERPKYSVLDTQKLRERFGILPFGMEPSLRECLQEFQAGS